MKSVVILKKQKYFWNGILCVFGAVCFYGLNGVEGAVAQGSISAEAAVKNAEEKLEEASPEKTNKNSYLPPSISSDTFVPQEPRRASGGDGELAIKLRAVKLRGATVIDGGELAVCYQEFIGRTVNENHLATITDCMTKQYHDAGYSLSRAVIPPQDAEGGRVEVRIIEGFISRVIVDGGDGERFRINKMAAPLMAERPIKYKTLERQLLLISDISGVALEDTEMAEVGEMSGAFELTLKVKTWQLWSGSEIDNRGTKEIGPHQSYSNYAFNSLLGQGETISFGYSSIVGSFDELNFGTVGVDLPIGIEGMRLSAYVAASRSEPSDEYRKNRETKFDTLEGGVNLNMAVVRSRETSFWAGGGVWSRDNSEKNKFGRYINDKLRGITLFARLQHEDRFGGNNYLSANFRRGLDLGGSSEKGDNYLSRFDGDGEFNRFVVDYVRYQPLDEHWAIKFSGIVQLGSEGLLSSQEFYFGGSRFGRAYESGVVSGDSGAAASLELQYTHNLEMDWLKTVQFYGYADIGSIFDDGNSYLNGALLSSAGGGVRLYFDYGIEADIAATFPLDDDGLSDADSTEFFFRVSRSYKLDEISLDRGLALFDQRR